MAIELPILNTEKGQDWDKLGELKDALDANHKAIGLLLTTGPGEVSDADRMEFRRLWEENKRLTKAYIEQIIRMFSKGLLDEKDLEAMGFANLKK